jgi:hypothetical protein
MTTTIPYEEIVEALPDFMRKAQSLLAQLFTTEDS